MFFCYKITNLVNGKVYIGKTNRPHERWIEHQNCVKKYPLYNAIRKYGRDNFSFEIIAISEIESEINKSEPLYIKQYRSNINRYGRSFGYNLTDGGEGISGWKHSTATLQRMSEVHKGVHPTEEDLMKRSKSRTGILHTEETKKFILDNSKTAKLNMEIAEQIRDEYKMGGTTHTKLAAKYNVSQANIGFIISNKIWRK